MELVQNIFSGISRNDAPKFGLSERINDLGENDRLTEGQKAEVLELIRQELGK